MNILNIRNIENIDQKKKNFFQKQKKNLIIFLSFILKYLFDESLFNIQYIFKNKIMAIILAHICIIRYNFISQKFIKKTF